MKYLKIFIAVSLVIFTGCASNPPQEQVAAFDDFLKAYKFTQFVPSNQIVEPLSIMTKNDGFQEFVAFPEDCSWSIEPNIVLSKTLLTSLNKRVDKYTNLDLNVSKDILRSASLLAILEYSKIESVNLEFIAPYLKVVSRISAQETFNSGSEVCKNAAENESNIVIHQLLGVKGVKFSFIGTDGKKVGFDAEFLKNANLKGEIRREAESNGSVTINENLYIGFRAFSGQLARGALSDRVAFTILDPKEVDTRLNN